MAAGFLLLLSACTSETVVRPPQQDKAGNLPGIAQRPSAADGDPLAPPLQFVHADRSGEGPLESDRQSFVLAEGPQVVEPESATGQRIVAELRVAIEGQVVGQETEVTVDQLGKASAMDTDHA